MTYAILGAGLGGATLAQFSPPRTFPSSSPTRTPLNRARDLATHHAYVGSPSFTGLNRKDFSGSN